MEDVPKIGIGASRQRLIRAHSVSLHGYQENNWLCLIVSSWNPVTVPEISVLHSFRWSHSIPLWPAHTCVSTGPSDWRAEATRPSTARSVEAGGEGQDERLESQRMQPLRRTFRSNLPLSQ